MQLPGDQTKQTVISPTNDEGLPWFTCPKQGCIKTFRTNQTLQRHLEFRCHEIKLHEESQYDQIRHKWAEHCLSLKPQNPCLNGQLVLWSNGRKCFVYGVGAD